MRNKSITYNWHDPETSYLEAVLSRGDRRIADVIEEAWRHGAKFDSWSEYFNLQTWLTAMGNLRGFSGVLREPGTGKGRDFALACNFGRREGKLPLAGARNGLRRKDHPGL